MRYVPVTARARARNGCWPFGYVARCTFSEANVLSLVTGHPVNLSFASCWVAFDLPLRCAIIVRSMRLYLHEMYKCIRAVQSASEFSRLGAPSSLEATVVSGDSVRLLSRPEYSRMRRTSAVVSGLRRSRSVVAYLIVLKALLLSSHFGFHCFASIKSSEILVCHV